MLKNVKRLETIFNNSGVGILIVNKNREMIEINELLCKTLGYEYSELINKSVEILHVSNEAYTKFGKIAFDNVFNNNSLNIEYKFKHKKGHFLWIKMTGDMIKDTNEVLWIATNINDRVKFQEELTNLNDNLNTKIESQVRVLREKEKQLEYQSRLAQMGEMLNMISHQWRQPLVSISATTTYLYGKLLMDDFNKEMFKEELQLVEKSTQYLSNTINDFRNFFKIEKKKNLTNYEELINNTFNIINPILSNNYIEIETNFESKSKIFTIKNEMKIVLLNILKNAEDAFIENNTKNRKIIIKTFDKDDNSFLEISDNAGGIKAYHLAKVFDAYFTTKSCENGTGLGLYISKTIIENNKKGKITVCNNNLNGATFTIQLPIKYRQLKEQKLN